MRRFWQNQSEIFKGGLKLIGLGALTIILTYFRVIFSSWRSHWFEIGVYIVGGLGFLLGIVLILLDVVPKIREKYFPDSVNKSKYKFPGKKDETR